MKRHLAIACLALTAFVPVAVGAPAKPAALQTTGLGKHDTSAPIAVSSDQFVGDLNTKIGTYIGNVIVTQGDFKLRADRVKVSEVQNKPSTIEAQSNVVFSTASGGASGDNGVYDLVQRTITMTGHVVLTKEKNVMRGTTLVVNLDTGLAHLTAKDMPGGRVQGLFTPPPKNTAAPPAKTGGTK